MKTRELISVLAGASLRGALPDEVTGITCDSRAVRPGDLFVARPGLASDGHAFAAQAAANGAALLVVEKEPDPSSAAPTIFVPDAREALALLARAFHGRPASKLRLAGVTGTNGKTTSTHFLTAVARAAGERTGRIGTVGYDIAGTTLDAPHTTPEATVLNELLARMVAANVSFCAMEVSSHALEQRRSYGLDFAAALFTNLTQDHLDYHPDFESYYAAKRRLFRTADGGVDAPPIAIVNVDDAHGRRLAAEADGRVVTFGVERDADYRARVLDMDATGTRAVFATPAGELPVVIRMVGPFNVLNALGAAAAMRELGYAPDAVAAGIGSLTGVPGRMERVDAGQPFAVIVDYAHTPDALERVLGAARAATAGRLIAVFGCGGDRDRKKRPMMGRLATRIADRTWITSDNPRSEAPDDIVAEIAAGAREGGGRFDIEVDRRAAIEAALGAAGPGDTVVIAGKGHEPYQILRDRTIHFDDREEAARVLGALGYAGGGTGASGGGLAPAGAPRAGGGHGH
jgi:UDP-N-acetylmuramoyl-L-alanyl-D-glutamate--2,6-diaminopimelate ligase